MDVKEVKGSYALIMLTSDDVMVLCNVLNEVCHGAPDIPEFSTRMGVGQEEALGRLRTLNALYSKMQNALEATSP